jgi:HSP20 family protein
VSRKSVAVHETPETFVVSMTLEGVDPAAIDVSGFGNTLTVSGDFREEWEEEDDTRRWILRAQHFGAFERSLTLTQAVAPNAATTTFEDGVLMITLPKVDRADVPTNPTGATTGSAEGDG